MPPPQRKPRNDQAQAVLTRKRAAEAEFFAARKKHVLVDAFARAGRSAIQSHPYVDTHRNKHLMTGEVKDEGGRSVVFMNVREQRPSRPASADSVSEDRDHRRRTAIGASLLLKMQSVCRGVVSYQVEQKGKTRRARTGMRADALRIISAELYQAVFTSNEGEALVTVLKGVKYMLRASSGSKAAEGAVYAGLAELASAAAFRFDRMPKLRLDLVLEAISSLEKFPEASALRLMYRLGSFLPPPEERTRVPNHRVANCLAAIGSHRESPPARYLLSRMVGLFDYGTILAPSEAFGWMQNFSDSKEIHQLLRELVKAVNAWIGQVGRGPRGAEPPTAADMERVHAWLAKIQRRGETGGLPQLLVDLESCVDLY